MVGSKNGALKSKMPPWPERSDFDDRPAGPGSEQDKGEEQKGKRAVDVGLASIGFGTV